MKTDSEIQKDVLDELKWEPMLSAAEIGVAVKNAVVTLSGTVSSYAKKTAAEKAAIRVGGVKAVAEDIEVKLFSGLKKTDTDIAEAVLDVLRWHSIVKEEKIKIRVDDGWVTLEGEAEWEYERNSAQQAIVNLTGVRGVTNQIRLVPKLNVHDVKQKINAAFYRHANIDARLINIETIGSKVILTGKVRSLAEKYDAEAAVWAAPGVNQVENKLEVYYDSALASSY